MKKYSKDFFKKILNKVLVITVFSIVGIIIASLSFEVITLKPCQKQSI